MNKNTPTNGELAGAKKNNNVSGIILSKPYPKKQEPKQFLDKELVRQALTLAHLMRHYGVNIVQGEKVRCPFHGEDKNPSATIRNNFFYCFVCNEKHDVFSFIQHMERCTFAEALAIGAELVGIKATQSPSKARYIIAERKHDHSEKERIRASSEFRYAILLKVSKSVRENNPSWLDRLDFLLDAWLCEVPLWVDMRPLSISLASNDLTGMGFAVNRIYEEWVYRA